MKKILILATVPDGVNPEVIDISYTTPKGNFEQHRIYKSEFEIIEPPTGQAIHESAILNSNSPRESEWVEYGAKLVLKKMGL